MRLTYELLQNTITSRRHSHSCLPGGDSSPPPERRDDPRRPRHEPPRHSCEMAWSESEQYPQAKLDLPLPRTLGNLSISRLGDVRAGIAAVELGMIKEVIELGAELYVVSFANPVVLVKRPVPRVRPRRPQIRLAQTVGRDSERRSRRESTGVEPVLPCGTVENAAVQPVRPAVGVVEVEQPGILRRADEDRAAGLEHGDAGELPAAQYPRRDAFGQMRLARAERQFPEMPDNQPVRRVVRLDAPVVIGIVE